MTLAVKINAIKAFRWTSERRGNVYCYRPIITITRAPVFKVTYVVFVVSLLNVFVTQ